jgi:hypothetical protein
MAASSPIIDGRSRPVAAVGLGVANDSYAAIAVIAPTPVNWRYRP